jgi:hypothetical protein
MLIDSKRYPTVAALITAKLTLVLDNVGNPDFDQDPDKRMPGSKKETIELTPSNIEKVSDLVHQYTDKHELGGGNFFSALMHDGKRIGYLSYNGRIWNKDGTEMKLEDLKKLLAWN